MSQEVMVHGHMSLLSHQESGKEKVCHNTSNNGKKFLVGMVTADHNSEGVHGGMLANGPACAALCCGVPLGWAEDIHMASMHSLMVNLRPYQENPPMVIHTREGQCLNSLGYHSQKIRLQHCSNYHTQNTR
jgi:hypothetical protein